MALSVTGIGQDLYPTTIEDYRTLIAALLPGTGGVGVGWQFPVAPFQQETGLAVEVGAGRAVLEGRSAQGQGSYFVWSSEPEVVPWPAPVAQPRIDSLILVVADGQYGQVEAQGPSWLIVQGVASTTPVSPSVEAINAAASAGSWARICNVRVNPGDTVINPANISRVIPSHDGGWNNLALSSGITTYLGRTPQYRVHDGRVWLRGQIARTNGTAFTDAQLSGVRLASVPTALAPGTFRYGTFPAAAVDATSSNPQRGGHDLRGEIGPDANLGCYRWSPNYLPTWIGFDNFFWWLD